MSEDIKIVISIPSEHAADYALKSKLVAAVTQEYVISQSQNPDIDPRDLHLAELDYTINMSIYQQLLAHVNKPSDSDIPDAVKQEVNDILSKIDKRLH